MNEFKSKSQFWLFEILFGLLFTIAQIIVSVLFILHKNYWVLVFMALLLFGSTKILMLGIIELHYTGKVVLKVYDDHIEYLNRNKSFNKTGEACGYSEINKFCVIRNGYVVDGKREANKKSGHITFMIDKNNYCWLDLKDCFAAANFIIPHLEASQIDAESELKAVKNNKNN